MTLGKSLPLSGVLVLIYTWRAWTTSVLLVLSTRYPIPHPLVTAPRFPWEPPSLLPVNMKQMGLIPSLPPREYKCPKAGNQYLIPLPTGTGSGIGMGPRWTNESTLRFFLESLGKHCLLSAELDQYEESLKLKGGHY